MKNKFPNLTIGIPAHNEEKNISKLISSIMAQKIFSAKLTSILVICDDCTDQTINIVKRLQKHNKILQIYISDKRSGKADALNKIYRLSSSDVLITIDADVVFAGIHDVEILVKTLVSDKNLNLVGPRHIPTRTKTLFGHFSRISANFFLDAVYQYNDGNNFYSCMAVECMKKSFYKSFRFPKGTISDQCYAYGKSIAAGLGGFKLSRNACVIFGVAQSFHDWQVLSVRSTRGDKNDTLKHFGSSALDRYTIPKSILFFSILKSFIKSPVYTAGAIFMNLYIRLFPYNHEVNNGVWEMVNSSKDLYI